MMIKFLARGTGSAAAAADYLTREQNLSPEQKQDQDQDPEPEKNPEEVKVLRGNPHQVAEVADALEFEHKYTSGVLKQAQAGVKTAEICRQHGISEQTFYRWKAKYGGLELSEAKRLRQLEDENRKLKQLVADLSLDKQALQDVLSKNF